MSLQWRPEMAIDHGIIDHDHQILLSIVSDFVELKPYIGGTAELQRTMARLHHYANTHFAREEALQRASRFPGSSEHERQHGQLIERIDVISQRLIELDAAPQTSSLTPLGGDIAVIDASHAQHLINVHSELSQLLRNWILGHILKTDLPMRQHVTAMQPFAAAMPSLWKVKPVCLTPAIDTPGAAKLALANAKGWMSASFKDERETPNAFTTAPAATPAPEHPVLARLRREAHALGMNAIFDERCENFSSTALSQVHQLVTRTRPDSAGPNGFDLSPSDARPYLRQTALFQRTTGSNGEFHYCATHVGTKFSRIFGDIANQPLETATVPNKFKRWKLLVDGALDFNAPLRVVSVAEAFGREDLTIERLLVPFRSADRVRDDVMIVASYDIALD